MGTTICDICNGAVSEDDLRGELKVGTGKHDGRGEEVRCLQSSACTALPSPVEKW